MSSAFREKRKKAYEDFEYFWNKKSVFSQWYPSQFRIDGIDFTFTCAEQYMMFKKAELFSDTDAMEIIQALTVPKEMKDIGRKVQGLSFKIWKERAIDIVREGNIAKFSQNETLKEMLVSTYPKELVEASPYDPIWGIGLAEDWEQAYSKETWRGLNLLGYILTDIRNELMKKDGIIDEHGVIPVDLEALKARYVASEVNDDAEMDATSKEEQLAILEGLCTRMGHSFGGNNDKREGKKRKRRHTMRRKWTVAITKVD
ncbi:N-glycosidase Npun_R5314-like [Dreissena polymorpha]|nr:N-glycosidase Npun_R5314-like [Dreissena polymorpha]